MEYFEQEIYQNIQNIPLIGDLLKKFMEDRPEDKQRLSFFEQITDIAHQHNKELAVIDIANKPTYELYNNFWWTTMFIPAIMATQLVSEHPSQAFSIISIALSVPLIAFYNHYSQDQKINHFSEKSSKEALFDFEDARRVFAAQGISALAHDLNKKEIDLSKDRNPHRIVAFYPKAHNLNIANYLINSPSQLKQTIYKAPSLDHHPRVYRPVNSGWEYSHSSPNE